MSIRWKLLLTALAPTTLAFVLLISFNAWAFQDYFQETIGEDLAARARLLRDSVADAVAAGFLDRAVPADDFDAEVGRVTAHLAGLNADAFAATKQRLNAPAIEAVRIGKEKTLAEIEALAAT